MSELVQAGISELVKDRNRSAFPLLEKGVALRVFELQVEAVKTVNTRYEGLETLEKKAAFEVAQLLLASAAYPEALEALCDVAELKKKGEFNDASGAVDSKLWLEAAWNALRNVCEPYEQDERDRILAEFLRLPQRSMTEFAGDVAPLIIAFKHLKSLAGNYEGLITDAESARILLSCLDQDTAKILRLTLKQDQKQSKKVVEAIQILAEASGGQLGNNASNGAVTGDLMYVSSINRLPTDAKPSRGSQFARGNRRPNVGSGDSRSRGDQCGRCGYEHAGQQCPATGQYCRYCSFKGHFERACNKKKRDQAAHSSPGPSGAAPTYPATGAAATGVDVLDARCPQDDIFGWMASGHAAPCPPSLAHSLSTDASPSTPPWFCDTACTEHVVARAYVDGCILRERPKVTQYRLAKRGLSFDSYHEAAVIVTVTGVDGAPKDLLLKLNLSSDSDVPALIKPHHLRLGPTPEVSWATIRDYYGDFVKVRIDDPMGTSTGTIPSFMWTPKPVDQATGACHFTRSRANCCLSKEAVQRWHVRLLHPGALRLRGTLQEQGYDVSEALCWTVTSECTTCLKKNAVTHTPPPSTSRRSPEQPFNHQVVWDLGHVHEVGYGGEHAFSLLVDEATLTWRAKALKAKSSAPAHLLEWIHDEGPMKALQSDNAGELKSTQVQLICRDNNVHMVVTPPYTSAANGVVERAIRELRGLLRTAVDALQLPFALWPALLPGLCALHNNSVSPLLKTSPAQRRFNFPPRLSHIIGDPVVVKLPGPTTAPKTLALPGSEVVYLGELNSSSALVYRREPSGGTVVRVHPSQIRATTTRRPAPTSSSRSCREQPPATPTAPLSAKPQPSRLPQSDCDSPGGRMTLRTPSRRTTSQKSQPT
eukprot:GHVU01182268.1.p1 GENE.GHVU01182268.1~~GHVU01182268.1.p1  ORF type:complete len:878 (-),score=111.10 GHVU01182268.1:360-2993(-)